MSSPRRLRDAKGACFPSESQQRQPPPSHSQSSQRSRGRDPKLYQDACEAMDAGRFRGASLARYVEEPLQHVTGFLATKPAPHQINDVLTLYKAFVVELASLANDTTPLENQWRKEGNQRSRELARKKFSKLKSGNPRICSILDAYRDAADRLDRALRRITEDMATIHPIHSQPTSRSASHTGFLDVGKIVSSGFDLLFGDSQSDVFAINQEEWVSKYPGLCD